MSQSIVDITVDWCSCVCGVVAHQDSATGPHHTQSEVTAPHRHVVCPGHVSPGPRPLPTILAHSNQMFLHKWHSFCSVVLFATCIHVYLQVVYTDHRLVMPINCRTLLASWVLLAEPINNVGQHPSSICFLQVLNIWTPHQLQLEMVPHRLLALTKTWHIWSYFLSGSCTLYWL